MGTHKDKEISELEYSSDQAFSLRIHMHIQYYKISQMVGQRDQRTKECVQIASKNVF